MEVLKDNFKWEIQIEIFNTFVDERFIVNKAITILRFLDALSNFSAVRSGYLCTVCCIAAKIGRDKESWRKFLHKFDPLAHVYLEVFIRNFILDCMVANVERVTTSVFDD